MRVNRNVAQTDFSLAGANLRKLLQVGTASALSALVFPARQSKVDFFAQKLGFLLQIPEGGYSDVLCLKLCSFVPALFFSSSALAGKSVSSSLFALQPSVCIVLLLVS